MSPDLFRPQGRSSLPESPQGDPIGWAKRSPSPKEARPETTPSGANGSRAECAHVRLEQVPRDFVSQVDYDWLVVDTNCSPD